MKNTYACLAGMIGLLACLVPAPEVVEAPLKEVRPKFMDVLERLENIRSSPKKAIRMLNEALLETREPFERFHLIFWELPALYCETGNPQAGLDTLQSGQREGLYYPFIFGQNIFPPYAGRLEKLDGFPSFLEANKKLREADQLSAKFEYMVRLPKAYSSEKAYPVLMVLSGGFGSHIQLMQDWHSPGLESGFVTIFLQGEQCLGSYLRAYPRDRFDSFVRAFSQIVDKYSVDRTKVFLGAQSAGAHFAFRLMLDELIPVRGLVLAFPAVPELDPSKLKAAAGRDVRVSILAGENDPRAARTKDMSDLMDRQGMVNHLIVFPGKGHEFPDDFRGELDRALNSLMK